LSTQARRKPIRLPGFDYSSEGAYFVTLITHHRDCLFGDVVNDEMVLSEFGRIVEFTWNDIPNHNPNVGLGAFVIMPNHVHGIIHLFTPQSNPLVGVGSKPTPNEKINRAGYEPAPTIIKTIPLSEIVRQLKTFSAQRINTLRGTPGIPVWQRNYYDHIIRSEYAYSTIEQYIQDNPRHWAADKENDKPVIARSA
jgi:putative transposase